MAGDRRRANSADSIGALTATADGFEQVQQAGEFRLAQMAQLAAVQGKERLVEFPEQVEAANVHVARLHRH